MIICQHIIQLFTHIIHILSIPKMSTITGDNFKFVNEAIIKYISFNDVISFYNTFKIRKCSKCVNWCNDKLSPLYFNWKQDQGIPRNHIYHKHKDIIDNNGNIISVEITKDSFVQSSNIDISTSIFHNHIQEQEEQMK